MLSISRNSLHVSKFLAFLNISFDISILIEVMLRQAKYACDTRVESIHSTKDTRE